MKRTRSRHARVAAVGLLCIGTLLLSACGGGVKGRPPPLGTISTQFAQPPQWPLVADPWVMTVGGTYYVFGSNGSVQAPVTPVTSLSQTHAFFPWIGMTKNALAHTAAWAFDNTFWAPTVGAFNSGYVMFFTAFYGSPNLQCIGRAFASAPDGPYFPEAAPFNCGLDGFRGALDPGLFLAPNGQWYLHMAFADTETPIYGMPLDANSNPAGPPSPVLGKRFAWEGRFIENPSMTYDWSNNTYLLAYSAGDWWTPSYSTGLARCGTPLGPCSSNPGGPWLTNGSGRTGVGGLSFFHAFDGNTKAAYASFTAGDEGVGRPRAGTVASVQLGNAPALGPP